MKKLRTQLLELLRSANSAGRGRLDSDDYGMDEEALEKFTKQLDAILEKFKRTIQ